MENFGQSGNVASPGVVSCIIPYYNGAETITRAIDSVINSIGCFEVVVVNDASPQPLEPCFNEEHHEYIKSGKLRVITLSNNHGQAAARNIGAAISTGEYLSFLDQDDIYLPRFYEEAIAYMEMNPGLGALEVGAEFVQDDQIILDEPDPRYVAAISSVPWNVLIRRNIFWACGAFPVGAEFRTRLAGEDVAFKTALQKWFPVRTASNKFIRHYIHPGSATKLFLERTEVVDGQVRFKNLYTNENDGSLSHALDIHIQRASKALQAECNVFALSAVEKSQT